MSGHRGRVRLVVVVAVLLVVGTHVTLLRVAASRVTVPAAIALGVIALVVIMHRRMLNALGGLFRRRPRRSPES